MPIYEYRCTDCAGEFEYQQRMSEDPKSVCESCGGSLERLISLSAFHLKGSGWYKDLYSSGKPAADKAAPGDATGKDTASASKDSGGAGKDSSPAGSPAGSSSAGSSSSSDSGSGSSAARIAS